MLKLDFNIQVSAKLKLHTHSQINRCPHSFTALKRMAGCEVMEFIFFMLVSIFLTL